MTPITPLPIDHPRTAWVASLGYKNVAEIPVVTWAQSRPLECFQNAKAHAMATGSHPIYGRLAWIIGEACIRLEAHAVVEIEGKLVDITPYPDWAGKTRTFFVDEKMGHSESRIPNRVFPLNPQNPTHVVFANVEKTTSELAAKFWKEPGITPEMRKAARKAARRFPNPHLAEMIFLQGMTR